MASKTIRVMSNYSGSSAPQNKRRKLLFSGLIETCMYTRSMSTVMESFRSQNLLIPHSRLQSMSGAVRSISFRQTPLKLDKTFETAKFSWLVWVDYAMFR